jgi:hypothetical protein
VSNLTDFGIDAEMNAVEGTVYFSKTLPNFEYEVTRGSYSDAAIPQAWFRSWLRHSGPSEEQFPAHFEEPFDSPVVQVPPIGEPESDDTVEIDVRANYDALLETNDPGEIRERSKNRCWAFNQVVPRIPVSLSPYKWYLRTDDWWVPDADSPFGHLQGLVWVLPQVGGIGRKGSS